ncbi:TRAP transporter substrate-binding protein [Halostella sp. JP-L12]|uniref:TAXI family TRAP transporter solute-binding subunit n=1 Tax=Halostella TaxID=1843185 RepID=UPI000EF837C3|nr:MULTISPECIES: TAXI family TRAP transporter solute-binding subunit [Halostella]NHN48027.1 TRAP transporter substrate-binding protein [Halostella sp. JP-L12]
MTESNKHYRRTFIKGASAAGILGVAGCLDQTAGGSGGGDGGGSNWTLGTSSEGSSSFRIGSTWTQYAEQNDLLDNVGVEAVVTEGTSASYRRLDNDEFEMSGTTTQLLADSPDQGAFSDQSLQDFDSIRQVRGYMGFYNFGVYNADKVSGWDDLEGRSVAISSSGSGTRPPVEWLVDQEIGLDNIDNRYMAFADIPAALRSGQVDAAFTWTVNQTIPQGWFQEIDATVNWEPLQFSDSTIDKLNNELGYSTYVELDSETVSEFAENYQDPIDSFTLTYLYVVKSDRDPERVYEITKMTYEHGEDLLEEDEVMGFFPDPDAFLGTLHPDVPVHQGAYDYYTEEGLWEDYDLTPPPEA